MISYSKKKSSNKNNTEKEWYCHCCMAKNSSSAQKCSVCSRDRKYAIDYYLPLHGIGAASVRTEQLPELISDPEAIYQTDSLNWTALHSCAHANNIPVVEQLLARGSVVNAASHAGFTPLHLAAFSGADVIVEMLLSKGADVRLRSEAEANSALHLATEQGHREVVRTLLKAGADADCKNLLERTPFLIAAAKGRPDIGLVLLQAKANVEMRDVHGWSARDIASFHQNEGFLDLLDELDRDKALVPADRRFPAIAAEGGRKTEAISHNFAFGPAVSFLETPSTSSLWLDVVRMRSERKKDLAKEKQQWQIAVQESNAARHRIQELQTEATRSERRLQLAGEGVASVPRTNEKRAYDRPLMNEDGMPLFIPPPLSLDAAHRLQDASYMLREETAEGARLGKDRRQRAPVQTGKEQSDALLGAQAGNKNGLMHNRLLAPIQRI